MMSLKKMIVKKIGFDYENEKDCLKYIKDHGVFAENYNYIVLNILRHTGSEEIKLEAIKKIGWGIKYIKNPSKQVKLAAVSQNGNAICYIKRPSEEIKLAAVKNNGNAIFHIKNPSEKVQLAAVKQTPFAIRYLKKPSKELQIEAVKKNPSIIVYIEDPSIELQKIAIGNKYNLDIIALCPNWRDFEEEILTNMNIKDIIE